MISPHGNGGGHLGAVVAGKYHQSIVSYPEFLKGFQQFSHHEIKFKNKVSVRAGFGFFLEGVAGKRRQMHGLHGVKQEEGFVG